MTEMIELQEPLTRTMQNILNTLRKSETLFCTNFTYLAGKPPKNVLRGRVRRTWIVRVV